MTIKHAKCGDSRENEPTLRMASFAQINLIKVPAGRIADVFVDVIIKVRNFIRNASGEFRANGSGRKFSDCKLNSPKNINSAGVRVCFGARDFDCC